MSDNATNTFEPLPNSKRIYVVGSRPDLRVPMREISLSPTNKPNGSSEANEPVRVYDVSGPWGDPDYHRDVTKGLPEIRRQWILERGDVEEYEGRQVKPADDGSSVTSSSNARRSASSLSQPVDCTGTPQLPSRNRARSASSKAV